MPTKQLSNPTFLIILSVVFALTAIIYANSLDGFFTLDDLPNLKNIFLDELSISNLKYVITQNSSGFHELSRTIPSVSFFFTHLLHGDSVWGFRYHNLLLHLAIGLVCFLFTLKLTRSIKNDTNLFIPALVTALWLLHPLHVSTTLYSVQRIAQFSTFFILLALISYITAINSTSNKKKLVFYLVFYPLACVGGLMSKENIAVVCFCIIPIFYTIKNAHVLKIAKTDTLFIWLYGWATTFIILATVCLYPSKFTNYTNRDFTLIERLYTQVDVILLYGQQIIFPRLSKMGLLLDDIPIISEFSIALFLKLLLILTLIIVCIHAISKGKIYGMGILFFLGHTIESTIIPLEIAFEHRNYFPMIGILFTMAALIDMIRSDIYKLTLSFTILVFFSVLLHLRVGFWSNEHQWMQTNFAYHPNSLRTNYQYINYLVKYGFYYESLEHVTLAQEKFPNSLQFQVTQLILKECIPPKEDDYVEIDTKKQNMLNIFNNIESILGKRRVNLSDYNALAKFVLHVDKGHCKHIELKPFYKLINFTYHESTKHAHKAPFTADLNALRANLIYRMGDAELSAELFKSAYKESGTVEYLFGAVELLLSKEKLHDQGLTLLEEIKNDKYFKSNLYIKQITLIEKQRVLFKQSFNN